LDKNRSSVSLRDFNVMPSYQTMALSVITPADDHRIARRRVVAPGKSDADPWYYPTTSTRDIGGTEPRTQQFTNNRGVTYRNNLAKSYSDVPGMAPRQLHPASAKNVPDTNLRTDDIPGTQCNPKDIIKRPRGTNPLAPSYDVATFEAPPPPPPPPQRFVRDSMRVDDIDGAQTRTLLAKPRMRGARENRLDASDIEGTAVGWKPPYLAHFGKPGHERSAGLDSSDIDGGTTRYTYTLEQREHKKNSEAKAIVGHTSRPLGHSVTMSTNNAFAIPRDAPTRPKDNSLRRWDIDGARPTKLEEMPFAHMPPRTEGRETPKDEVALTRTQVAARRRAEVSKATARRSATAQAVDNFVASHDDALAVDTNEIVKVMKRRDVDGNGRIQAADAEAAFNAAGYKTSDGSGFKEVTKLMEDGDGRIQYRDLARFAVPSINKVRNTAMAEKRKVEAEQARLAAAEAKAKADAAAAERAAFVAASKRTPPKTKPESAGVMGKYTSQRYNVQKPPIMRPKTHIADSAMNKVGTNDANAQKVWKATRDADLRGKMMACGMFEFENWGTQQLLAKAQPADVRARVEQARKTTTEMQAATRRLRISSAPAPGRRAGVGEAEARQARAQLNVDMATIRSLA